MKFAYEWVPGCDGGMTKVATHKIQARHTPHAYAMYCSHRLGEVPHMLCVVC